MKKYTLIIALCFASCDFTKQTPATNPFKPDFEYVAHSYEDTRAFYGKEVLQKVAAAAPEVLKTMNKALPNAKDAFVQVPLNKVQKADIAPYYAIEEENGERSYYQWHLEADGEKVATKLDATTTYLALDIDQFHVEENEEGQEVYPLTFEAIPMEQSNKQAAVNLTLQEDGTITGLDSGDNLVFLTGVDVSTNVDDMNHISKILDFNTKLGLLSIKFKDISEGAGGAEVYVATAEEGKPFNNHVENGSESPAEISRCQMLSFRNTCLANVPDVSKENKLYNFNNIKAKKIINRDGQTVYNPYGNDYNRVFHYFPIMGLEAGKNKEVILHEDDYLPTAFYSHGSNLFASSIRVEKNVQTYRMNPNIPENQRWIAKDHNIKTYRKILGNLDDIIPYSAVTQVSLENVLRLTGYGSAAIPVTKDGYEAYYNSFSNDSFKLLY